MGNLHKQKQKIYTAEFKREAVRLLETSGKSGALIAEELGISDGSFYTWRKQLAARRSGRRGFSRQRSPDPDGGRIPPASS